MVVCDSYVPKCYVQKKHKVMGAQVQAGGTIFTTQPEASLSASTLKVYKAAWKLDKNGGIEKKRQRHKIGNSSTHQSNSR